MISIVPEGVFLYPIVGTVVIIEELGTSRLIFYAKFLILIP
ncbi:hypothetical protein [Caudoviricetes sp.]|nr:hypothetical protein [Caudoviricetes sp.]